MTAPQIEWKISVGNIFQMVLLLSAIIFAYSSLSERSEENAKDIADIVPRLRIVEAQSVQRAEQFVALQDSMNEVKSQQRDIYQVLRQLLAQGGIRQ